MKHSMTLVLILTILSSQASSQRLEDVGAAVINFLISSPKTANMMKTDQRIALGIISDLLKTEGQRKHELEYASQSSDRITINVGDGRHAEFVRNVTGEVFLLLDGIIYPVSAQLVKQADLENLRSDLGRFRVYIEQNGEIKPESYDVVSLDRTLFNIVLEFSKPMGVLVNASFHDNTFQLASKAEMYENIAWPSGRPGVLYMGSGAAEDRFNTYKNIFVSDESSNYWYFTADVDNRFNVTERQEGRIICRRTIQQLHDLDSGKTTRVSEVDKDLYLVFLSFTKDQREMQRSFLRITWNPRSQ